MDSVQRSQRRQSPHLRGNLANDSKPTGVRSDYCLATVKTTIYGAISQILMEREFIDQRAFALRCFARQNRMVPYEEILANKSDLSMLVGSDLSTQTPSTHFLMRSPKAEANGNIILKWLEEGVFDALDRGFLKAIQLRIIEPTEGRVVEAYRLGLRRRRSVVQHGKEQGISLAMVDLTQSLSKALERLRNVMYSLAALPRGLSMEMFLSFNDRVPDDYHSSIFSPKANPHFDCAASSDWKWRTNVWGFIDTAFDRMEAEVEFLGYRPHHAEPGPSTIPSDLPMTERHFVDDMFRCYRRVRILDSHEDEDSTRDRRFHHKHEIAAQEEDSTSSTPSLDRGLTPEQLQPVTLAKATPPEIRQSRELRALRSGFQKPFIRNSQLTQVLTQTNSQYSPFSTIPDSHSPNTRNHREHVCATSNEPRTGQAAAAAFTGKKRKANDASLSCGSSMAGQARFYCSAEKVLNHSPGASSGAEQPLYSPYATTKRRIVRKFEGE